MSELMEEFNVSRSTIRRDIDVLSMSFPLTTSKGTGGGVRIMDGYNFGNRYLSKPQYNLLLKLSESLPEEDRQIMESILKDFSHFEVHTK